MIQLSVVARIGTISALFIAGCATTSPPDRNSALTDLPRSEEIYVIRRGWHTDIGFDAASVAGSLHQINAQLPPSRYLQFGFGDRRYLLTHDNGSSGALEALWPGPAVILVTGLIASPQSTYERNHVIRIKVTPVQLLAAQEYLANSFASAGNQLEPVARAPNGGSVYFTARHRYSALFTCNSWAADLLAAADLPIDTTGVVIASKLWSQVRRVGASAAQSASQQPSSLSGATY
jgi:hypothetical protein